MKLYDIIMGAGFIGTFAVYYANKAYKFAEKLGIDGELYRWTFGGLPEFFTGAVGIRLGDAFLKFTHNQSKKIKNKIVKKIAKPLENYAVRVGLTATAIMGLGTLDEVVVNLSGGSQDPWDIAKYAGGVALSIGIGAMYNKKKKNKELKEQKINSTNP